MAVCAVPTSVYAGPSYVQVAGSQRTAYPLLLSPDADVSTCQYLMMSQAEIKALIPPPSSSGASIVNVTADIFVGAALVCIFVLGWIAGAQR